MERFNVTNIPGDMLLNRNVMQNGTKKLGVNVGLIAVLLTLIAAIAYWFWSLFKSQGS
jgi:hypothetical protein